MAERDSAVPARFFMLTGDQLHAARILARLDQHGLAKEAGVSPQALAAAEARGPAPVPHDAMLSAVRRALERAGIRFLDENGPGVILARRGTPDEGMRPEALSAENDD